MDAEFARADAPLLAVGLDLGGLVLPPVGTVRVGGERTEELEEMVGLALGGRVAELVATVSDLLGQLPPVVERVGVVGKPALKHVLGGGQLIPPVGEVRQATTVIAARTGEHAWFGVAFGVVELLLGSGQFVGAVGWGVFGDPGVEVGQPGCKDGEGLGPFKGVAEMVESRSFSGGSGERADQDLARRRRWLSVVVVEGKVVGDDQRGVVASSSGIWSSYRTNMERHVIPRIGHVQLRQVGALHLNALYAELLQSGRCSGEGGLSARTVKYTHSILHRAFRDAVRWGLIGRNPADLADPPKQRSPEMQVWAMEELRTFLGAVRDDRLYALWLLLATTGLRRGEALGLRWIDLDAEGGRASIRQSLSSVGGKLAFSTPKTAKSRRSIVLDPSTLSALRAHRKQQVEQQLAWGSAYNDSGLIFAREDGSPIRPDTITRRFQELAKAAGLRPLRLHDLRHTYATIALGAGTHPKVVAERLGHSTIAVTLDIYSHVIPALEEQEAARLTRLILGDAG